MNLRGTLCKNNDQSLFATFRNNSSLGDFLQISAIAEEGVAMSQYSVISDFWTHFGKGWIVSKSLGKDCPMIISVILLFGSSQGNAQFCVLILDRNNWSEAPAFEYLVMIVMILIIWTRMTLPRPDCRIWQWPTSGLILVACHCNSSY